MRITESQARKFGIGAAKKAKDGKPAKERKSTKQRLIKDFYGSDVISFVVDLPIDPQPKERPRTVVDKRALANAFSAARGSRERFEQLIAQKTSRTFTPKNTVDYENIIKSHAMVAMAKAKKKPFECPVKTHIHLVFKGQSNEWPTSHSDGDVDNLEKAVLDALNKIVYSDDRLVVRSIRTKSCGPTAKVMIQVSPVNSRTDKMEVPDD